MDAESKVRRWRVRSAVGGIGVVAVILGVWAGVRAPTWVRMYRLRSHDPEVRREAVRDLGGRGGYAAVKSIRALITADPDPRVRDAAAYAAMQLGDREALGPIRQAILDHPGEEQAATMLAHYARLAPDDSQAAPFVDECGRSEKPYLKIGAAMARAEWFRAQGVASLLALLTEVPPECRDLVVARLRMYLIPAAQMVGVQFDAPGPWSLEHVELMRRWWAQNGSDRLLADALFFKRSGDADVREVERIQHARVRIGRMLGLLPPRS